MTAPIACIIMLLLSFATYDRAKVTKRSRFAWVAITWLLGIAVAFLLNLAYLALMTYGVGRSPSHSELTGVVLAGLAIGGSLAVWGAGRPLSAVA